MTTQIAVVLADATQSGLLETLSPLAVVFAGLVLLAAAGFFFWFNSEMLKEGSFILEVAGWICGIGGLVALFQGLFGS